MDLREQIGQRLVTGFPGTELTEDFRRMVREYKISNVILFRENITDCAQLKQLCGEIQALVRRETGHGAFITADQEGGLVTRLPGDAVNVPGAMAIAATGDPENAYRAGLLTGRELRALGVNFDLAPSVDVNSNPENPVIGARSYGCVGAPARRPGGLCRAVRRQRGRQQSAGTRAAGANAASVRIPGRASFDRRSGNRAGRRAGRTLRHGAYRGHRVHLFWQGCSG